MVPRWLTTIFSLTPLFSTVAILIPLLITLFRLRNFHKQYGMKIESTKLIIHFCLCLLILLVYFFNCLLTLTMYDIMHDFHGADQQSMADQLQESLEKGFR